MHQHIGAHDGHVFLPQDALAFLTVGQHYLNVLAGFLIAVGGITGAVAKDGAAALVGHADGGEIGTGPVGGGHGLEVQAGLLVHFTGGGVQHILAGFHQTSGELVDIIIDGVAELTDQHHLVLLLTMNAVHDDAVGVIVVGDGLDLVNAVAAGTDEIGADTAIAVMRLHLIQVQKAFVG